MTPASPETVANDGQVTAVPPEPPPELVAAAGAVEAPPEDPDTEVAAVEVVDAAAW